MSFIEFTGSDIDDFVKMFSENSIEENIFKEFNKRLIHLIEDEQKKKYITDDGIIGIIDPLNDVEVYLTFKINIQTFMSNFCKEHFIFFRKISLQSKYYFFNKKFFLEIVKPFRNHHKFFLKSFDFQTTYGIFSLGHYFIPCKFPNNFSRDKIIFQNEIKKYFIFASNFSNENYELMIKDIYDNISTPMKNLIDEWNKLDTTKNCFFVCLSIPDVMIREMKMNFYIDYDDLHIYPFSIIFNID